MSRPDPRIDAYIAKSADFARPILEHLRQLVHTAGPDVEETIKWSMPFFLHKGMLCHMAAFKAHCAFGFWKSKQILPAGRNKADEAMGSFGRLTSLADLPDDETILGYIQKAIQLNDAGPAKAKSASKSRAKPAAKKPLVIPPVLAAALKKNKPARVTFENFSPSHKKEYVEWITDAKTDATRERRLQTTLQWLAEGKSRHWKYASC